MSPTHYRDIYESKHQPTTPTPTLGQHEWDLIEWPDRRHETLDFTWNWQDKGSLLFVLFLAEVFSVMVAVDYDMNIEERQGDMS